MPFPVLSSPDPILVAIERHTETWNAFQDADDGKPAERAESDMDEAFDRLLGTPCTTRIGAVELLEHLEWFLAETGNHHPECLFWRIAQARAADLTLLLGDRPCDAALRVLAIKETSFCISR